MYLLDTNICSAINDRNPKALAQFSLKYAQCYVTTIVIAELYKGAYCSQLVEDNLSRIEQLVSLMPTIVEFDQNAAIEFGIIQGELRRIGRPTKDIDALIAAVARSRGDILVTHNTRDFINIPGLQLEDWLEEE
ncbi:type II toxin-antitoxin system VapC family toxin [Argonema galeatum]|uniref:type II toxin-antitoxin system VapC family toxin n=1 Tax=Argonema galeatum TaxID=2942762 RepID=UPI002011FF7D|nr:type II toxin-antitoxin system VapC family toxin [Argonema galeatum A003/A1]